MDLHILLGPIFFLGVKEFFSSKTKGQIFGGKKIIDSQMLKILFWKKSKNS